MLFLICFTQVMYFTQSYVFSYFQEMTICLLLNITLQLQQILYSFSFVILPPRYSDADQLEGACSIKQVRCPQPKRGLHQSFSLVFHQFFISFSLVFHQFFISFFIIFLHFFLSHFLDTLMLINQKELILRCPQAKRGLHQSFHQFFHQFFHKFFISCSLVFYPLP